MYSAVTKDAVDRLIELVGAENVLTDGEALEAYSHDEFPGLSYPPEVVVRPGSTAEVSSVMRLACERRIPVTPRGLGSGLTGGALAVHGGIVLSLERMKRILEIDEENLMAVVEPGVLVGHLQREVERRMLFYPPDPASLDSCSIGGNVAENAGGPRAVKYGVTRDYVTGLEVVLASGEVVNYGGKLVKNVAGYDLTHFFIGTEGTLGIITRVTLRLIPLPRHRLDLLVPFPSHQAAAETVSRIMRDKGIVPVVLEFMDRECVLAVEQLLERELPFREAAAQLIIGLDGPDPGQLLAEAEVIGEICLSYGAEDVLVADNERDRNRLWEARRIAYEALKHSAEQVELEDLVVPRTRIPDIVAAIEEASRVHDLPLAVVGHAGDGNVHVVLLKRGVTEEVWREKVDRINGHILAAAVRLGGSIAGEHGVGLLKKRFLGLNLGEAEIEVMRKLKDALDPHHLLNPGKILP